jgi:hypothetical protein
VAKDAAKIPGMMNVVPITAATSFQQASSISADQERAARDAVVIPLEPPIAHTEVTLTQNNTSPKALSTIDIYRQSKNLLAQAKTAAGIP